jgi:sigma-54 dependent transcriptional regulator, acetoin dehydrogenase operon transcriptional activator AcoR
VRSTSAGIDPSCGQAPSAEGELDVERLKHANRELYRAARGSIKKIGRMLYGTEAMLVLTDAQGLVIEQIGDPKTIRAGEKINLHVGGLWNEDAVGTNGIGTALWAGQPMFVHGSEHYVETLKEWSCAAAPIRNPLDQSVIGVVDLSGLTKIFRQHNTAFAAAAAGEIQAALTQTLNEECIRLLDALIEQVPLAGQEDGIVILDRAGRVLHRSGFERLILPDGTELDTRKGKRLVPLEGEPSPDRVAALLPPNLRCREVSNLEIDGQVRGIALIVDCGGRPPWRGRASCPARGSSRRARRCSRPSTSRAGWRGSTLPSSSRARPAPARNSSPA